MEQKLIELSKWMDETALAQFLDTVTTLNIFIAFPILFAIFIIPPSLFIFLIDKLSSNKQGEK